MNGQSGKDWLAAARKVVGAGLRELGLRPPLRKWTAGLPPGLDAEIFEDVCVRIFGAPLRQPTYLHLSPFKAVGGAYRVRASNQNDSVISVCYKDCRYGSDSVPALSDHPAILGPSEFSIYSQTSEALRQLLPSVYYAKEIERGGWYQYILEDLQPRFSKPSTSDAIIHAAHVLPDIHVTVTQWADVTADAKLITYDQDYLVRLATYVEQHLEAYGSRQPADLPVSRRELTQMIALISHDEYTRAAPPTAIHGDLNNASILLETHGGLGYRVIDWEWAGIGPAHFDLARLLEFASPVTRDRALVAYAEKIPGLEYGDHKRRLAWAQLIISLMTAAMLAAEILAGGPAPRIDRVRYIRRYLQAALAANQQLGR